MRTWSEIILLENQNVRNKGSVLRLGLWLVQYIMHFCFVCLRLVYPMLPVSMNGPYLMVLSAFSSVYLDTIPYFGFRRYGTKYETIIMYLHLIYLISHKYCIDIYRNRRILFLNKWLHISNLAKFNLHIRWLNILVNICSNKRWRISKGHSRVENQETQGTKTQNEVKKQNKTTKNHDTKNYDDEQHRTIKNPRGEHRCSAREV